MRFISLSEEKKLGRRKEGEFPGTRDLIITVKEDICRRNVIKITEVAVCWPLLNYLWCLKRLETQGEFS